MSIQRNLLIATLMTVVTTVLLGLLYPLAVTGAGAGAVSRSREWAADRSRRRDGRLSDHRPAVHVARLFPAAALRGGRGRLRRGRIGWHEPRADEQEAHRSRERGHYCVGGGEPRAARSDRAGNDVGVRAGPAHLTARCGVPGTARCARAWRFRSYGPTVGSAITPKGDNWAFSVNPSSTFCC